jgi:SAM-dependent methyltransferase
MLALAGDVAGLRVLDAGCGPGPYAEELIRAGAHVVGCDQSPALVSRASSIALARNHDIGVTGSVEPSRLGPVADRSNELARKRLSSDDMPGCARANRPPDATASRPGTAALAIRCGSSSGTRNAGACLAAQKAPVGLVGHIHVPDAWQATAGGGARRVTVVTGVALDISEGKWLLNPGAVGAPRPSQLRWWNGLDAQAAEGAPWLLLDLDESTATWHRAPFDPAPARRRAPQLGLA